MKLENYTTVYRNATINANTYGDFNFSIAKEGYKPVGIAGFRTDNSASNGSGASYVLLGAMSISGESVWLRFRNRDSAQAKFDITVNIMYEKE